MKVRTLAITLMLLVAVLGIGCSPAPKPASDINCEQLMEMFKGHKFVFGIAGEVEITYVKDSKEESRSPNKLVCVGTPRYQGIGWGADDELYFIYEQLPDGTWDKAAQINFDRLR